MRRWKTYSFKADSGPGQATHLEGIGDSYALCGVDVAGDPNVHRKPPEPVSENARITCEHCKQIVQIVKQYLNEK